MKTDHTVRANNEFADHQEHCPHQATAMQTVQMEDARPWRPDLATLRLGVELGSVVIVSVLLENSKFRSEQEAAGPEALEVVRHAVSWLAGASEHERRHGAESKINRSHPFYLRYWPSIERHRRFKRPSGN